MSDSESGTNQSEGDTQYVHDWDDETPLEQIPARNTKMSMADVRIVEDASWFESAEEKDTADFPSPFDPDTKTVEGLLDWAITQAHQADLLVDVPDEDLPAYSDWLTLLDIGYHRDNPGTVLEAIAVLEDSDPTTDDWFEGVSDPVHTNQLAIRNLQFVNSICIAEARADDDIESLSAEQIQSLAEFTPAYKNALTTNIVGTVSLAQPHPEFPREAVIDNDCMYTVHIDPHREDIRGENALNMAWYVDPELAHEIIERFTPERLEAIFTTAEGLAGPDELDFDEQDVDKRYEAMIRIFGKKVNYQSPYVFTGDPSGTLTDQVAQTLPVRSAADLAETYRFILDCVNDLDNVAVPPDPADADLWLKDSVWLEDNHYWYDQLYQV